MKHRIFMKVFSDFEKKSKYDYCAEKSCSKMMSQTMRAQIVYDVNLAAFLTDSTYSDVIGMFLVKPRKVNL